MIPKRLGLAAFAIIFAATGLATAASRAETKTTTAKPVVAPAAQKPPEPRQPDDAADRPGILDGRRDKGRVGIGEDITIAAGETHEGDVVCIRGHVTIDGHVIGDVTVIGGSLDIKGSVDGDVTGVASRVDIDPKATIDGDVTNVGGSLRRNGASVQGQVVNVPFGLVLPSWGHGFRPGWGDFAGFFFWWRLFAVFLFFVCALLLSALVPDRIRVISQEAPGHLFTAFVFGLIGYVVFGIAEMFLTITLIGIPLVFLLYLVFVVLKWLAMCGIFHQIGSRIANAMGREASLLGAILLGFLPFALLRFVPFCVGFSVWFLVEILAFGYLILTRVGTIGGASPITPARPPDPPSTSPGVIVS
jgi:hypothetical protein